MPGRRCDVSTLMVMGTDPLTPMVLVGAVALSQFPPLRVVDEMVNEVPALPKLFSVELPVTIPDPEPFGSDTLEGLALRLSVPTIVNVTGTNTSIQGAAVHCSETVPW